MNNFDEEPHNPIMTIEDKGKWVEMSSPELETMFAGLTNYLEENRVVKMLLPLRYLDEIVIG